MYTLWCSLPVIMGTIHKIRRRIMRKTIRTYIAFLAVTALMTSVAYAQMIPGPAAWVYNMKKVGLKGFRACHDIKDWVVTGKKTSVVFATDWDWKTSDLDLVAFGMNKKGKASQATEILPGYVSSLIRLSAIWIEDTSAPPPAKKKSGQGLVFAGYQSTNRKTATLAVRRFGANGAMIGGWKTIKSVSAGANQIIADQWIKAEIGPASVAVAYSVLISENSSAYYGYKSSEAYFVETDFNGDLLPQTGGQKSLRAIRVPDNGKLKIFRTFKPAWNGRRWLIPICNTRLKIVPDVNGTQDYWKLIGEDVLVQAVKSRTQTILKPRKLFGHNNSKWYPFVYDLRFLPVDGSSAISPTGKVGDTLKLYYRQITPPSNQKDYEAKKFFHGIVSVTGRAKKTGPTVVVDIPSWNRTLPYDSDALISRNDDYISSPIPAGDGTILLAQIYTLARGRNAAPPLVVWDYESVLNVLEIDPDTGDVKVLAKRVPRFGGFFDPPFVNWFNGKITVLNGLVYRGPQYHVDPYFSRF